MGIKIITPPVGEPITLQECRDHLRIVPFEESSSSDESHPDDAIVLAMLSAAREWAENFTGLSLAVKTYELALDRFPADEIELPMPPLVEILSVTYIDEDETPITIPPLEYVIDNYQMPGWLIPVRGTDWPTPLEAANVVKIRYRAGYAVEGDASEPPPLPAAARAGILLALGHLYEHREDSTEKALNSIPMGAQSMLRPLRIRFGMA
jgi:uncharacterized phiE125 gp8 family phage protein